MSSKKQPLINAQEEWSKRANLFHKKNQGNPLLVSEILLTFAKKEEIRETNYC
jgi:hypothetical protein